MDFEEWYEKYKPIKNHLARGEDRDYFETYDLELGYVLGIALKMKKILLFWEF